MIRKGIDDNLIFKFGQKMMEKAASGILEGQCEKCVLKVVESLVLLWSSFFVTSCLVLC